MKSQLRGVEVGDSAGSSRSHGQGREPEEVQNKLRKEFEKMERENPDVKLKDTNGWVDLCKTLRDADEREGKEVNENIDAILVFVRDLYIFPVVANNESSPDCSRLS